jgi:hypothetical protein
MFCRVETGFKSDFSDPRAWRIHQKIKEIHPGLAEKIRWIRRLDVVWLEFDAPRDKVVQSIQACFKNRVTDWVFTGDLLPSAAGSTGTLYDLMQESPFRPGIFHGIEKRKRLSVHDEEALIVCDAIQTVLGRRNESDRVVTGEILLLEGVKLIQSDLEWLARNWFAHENHESWSLLSEEELKKNSRFQSEQVAKYLAAPRPASRSKLLQFRASARVQDQPVDWGRVEELLRSRHSRVRGTLPVHPGEDWSFFSDISFSSGSIQGEALNETEFALCRHQLEHYAGRGNPRLQTVVGVLPEKQRLWRSEVESESPLKIRNDFEFSLERVSSGTATPVSVMKVLEDGREGAPAFFWTGTVSYYDPELSIPRNADHGALSELFFVGFPDQGILRNLTFLSQLKSAFHHGIRGEAIDFTIPASGRSLLACLKESHAHLQYGFDLTLDGGREGNLDWFKRFFESPLSLGFIWGVHSEKREWMVGELRARGIPFLHFGSTSLTGDIRVIEGGEVRISMNITEFFRAGETGKKPLSLQLLEEPVFLDEQRTPSVTVRRRYSDEDLVLKPEKFQASVPSPVVIRPSLEHWSGLMVLAELVDSGFREAKLDYILRKCTSLGGQIHSLSAAYLNGLQVWSRMLQQLQMDFGVMVHEREAVQHPEIQAHMLALQVIARVPDVRMVRTEEFKFANDRIYWLPGTFEGPGSRWLSGFEGRYQTGLHSAVAIESSLEGDGEAIGALVFALKKRKLGAEVRLQHHFPNGYFVSVSESERFAVEEEWRVLGIEFEFVGRVTTTPYLVVRNDRDQVETHSIEDLI